MPHSPIFCYWILQRGLVNTNTHLIIFSVFKFFFPLQFRKSFAYILIFIPLSFLFIFVALPQLAMLYIALLSSRIFLMSISILIDSPSSQYFSFLPGFSCLSQVTNLNYTHADIPGISRQWIQDSPCILFF